MEEENLDVEQKCKSFRNFIFLIFKISVVSLGIIYIIKNLLRIYYCFYIIIFICFFR